MAWGWLRRAKRSDIRRDEVDDALEQSVRRLEQANLRAVVAMRQMVAELEEGKR